jgi:hypothetical protein
LIAVTLLSRNTSHRRAPGAMGRSR